MHEAETLPGKQKLSETSFRVAFIRKRNAKAASIRNAGSRKRVESVSYRTNHPVKIEASGSRPDCRAGRAVGSAGMSF